MSHVSLTHRGAGARLQGADNGAERALAGELVESIRRLVGLNGDGIARTVAAALPAGYVKMFHVLGAEDDSLLALGDAPRPRLLADSNVEALLDEVGRFARNGLNLAEGSVPHDQATRVLNEIVSELFQRFTSTLARLSPLGLLEHLAAEQEGLIYQSARDRLLVPSQAACFGDNSSAVLRSLKTARDLTVSSPASRFIVEAVTASPPNGNDPLSVGTYDELLALARQIIEYGYMSDALHYGLSASMVSVLASGRLGIGRSDPYHLAVSAFSERLSGRALSDARDVFARHWRAAEQPGAPFDPTGLNAAFEAEFRLSATQLAEITGEMTNLALGEPRQIAVRGTSEAVSHLSTELGYPEATIRAGLEMITLRPMARFPDSADNYPWRFSRDRSAARRPVMLRERGHAGPELVWGPRALRRSGRYLLDQLLSARLKTRSDEMAHYITETRQAANADFNRAIADFFRTAEGLEVRENVKKLGTLRLTRADGNEIGDIDVLVVDRDSKMLLAIEVKDFEFARTPFEMTNEVSKLLQGPDSAVGHHEERLAYMRQHLPAVVTELSLEGGAGDWQIRGLVVTSHDLIALHLPAVERIRDQLSIISFEDMAEKDPRSLSVRAITPTPRKKRRKKSKAKKRRRKGR